jgi:hypothetical protein
MGRKISILKLAAVFAVILLFNIPAFGSALLSIDPISAYSGTNVDGQPRNITGAQPSDFKEDNEVITGFGSYSNRIQTRGQQGRYKIRIMASGDLISSTGKTIPLANLKYLFTYAGGPNGASDATGTKYNFLSYVSFSTSWQDIYLCSTAEAPFPQVAAAEREFQLKYAIQVPNNAAPGTYTTTLHYRLEDIENPFETVEHTAVMNVTVINYFRLSVDRGTIDFENMSPGQTKDNVPVEGAIVTAMTNTGNPWYLKISNNSPLSSGPYVIPNSNFIWYGWTDGTGIWQGTGTDAINFVPSLVYSSGAGETMNLPNGTTNHLKFKLTIPKGQPGGKYISNVVLTLTE